MLHPDAFRAELVEKLATLRELWLELGVPDYVTDHFWTEIERDLATELSATRPRQALLWPLHRVERFRKLRALDAPAIILRHEAAVMHEVAHHLRVLSASRRWAELDIAPVRLHFEPEPMRSARVGALTIRYPQYGEIDESDATIDLPVHEAPLSDAFLALLSRSPALWAQQRAILPGSNLAAQLDAELLTAEDVQVFKRGIDDSDGSDGDFRATWYGARELPFLCGRIAHLLGMPPEHPHAGFVLAAEDPRTHEVTPIYLEGGLDVPRLWTRGAAALDAAPIVAWLFADATVADIDAVTGRTRFGVRDGHLFVETLPPDVLVPGWLQSDA